MARIRSAKPEWWTDPRMVALKRVIRWTFKGLWEVCADDEGRFLADPRVIKGQLWPMDDDLTPRQIETHLAALATAGRISLYVADGVRYGVVVNFLKHQKISHPTPSRLPSPPLGGLASGAGNPPEAYRNGSGEIPERLRPERSGAERDVDLDVDLERSGSEGPPAPPADAGTGEEPAEPTSALPYHARRLISAMPPEKRADGEEQLLATLTDRGANLDGQRVRAFSIAHLEDACLYKLRGKRPEKPGLLARFVLQRLNDTFAEWKSRVEKSAATGARSDRARAAGRAPGGPDARRVPRAEGRNAPLALSSADDDNTERLEKAEQQKCRKVFRRVRRPRLLAQSGARVEAGGRASATGSSCSPSSRRSGGRRSGRSAAASPTRSRNSTTCATAC
jgi:hypothetical protein